MIYHLISSTYLICVSTVTGIGRVISLRPKLPFIKHSLFLCKELSLFHFCRGVGVLICLYEGLLSFVPLKLVLLKFIIFSFIAQRNFLVDLSQALSLFHSAFYPFLPVIDYQIWVILIDSQWFLSRRL